MSRDRTPASPVTTGSAADALTVAELTDRYWSHALLHYRKNGKNTSEISALKLAFRPVKKLYGDAPAVEFGPLCLRAVQQHMVMSKVTRKSLNIHTGRIKRMFKWAVAGELIPAAIFSALQALRVLQRGRSEAVETEDIKPVPQQHIDAVLKIVNRHIAAMIRLQLLTGVARPGEICIMRVKDIDTSKNEWNNWVYRPYDHKTIHHGHTRLHPLNVEAQKVLQPFLNHTMNAYLFNPQESVAEHLQDRRSNAGKTRSDVDLMSAAKRRAPKDHFDTFGYRRAIARACRKAGVPPWHPHQLRHNAATEIRKRHGIDAARAVLNHKTFDATVEYTELDLSIAHRAVSC